uniref:U-box domain-containing protein n=1 Tax=Ditylum brightwellii TaxID=49249 RepID=A0A7S1ZFJ4_9STRA
MSMKKLLSRAPSPFFIEYDEDKKTKRMPTKKLHSRSPSPFVIEFDADKKTKKLPTKKTHSRSPSPFVIEFDEDKKNLKPAKKLQPDVAKVKDRGEDEFGVYKKPHSAGSDVEKTREKRDNDFSMHKTRSHRAEMKMSDFVKTVVKRVSVESDHLEGGAMKIPERSSWKQKGKSVQMTTPTPVVDYGLSSCPSFTLISFENNPDCGMVGYDVEADDIADRGYGTVARSNDNERAVHVSSAYASSEYGHVINDCSAPQPVTSLPPLPESPMSSRRSADTLDPPSSAPPPMTVASESTEEDEVTVEIPNDLVCPITGDLMQDPVVAADGYTYERNAIAKWYRRFPLCNNPRSPTTNQPVRSRTLFPNYTVRSQCREFARVHGLQLESSQE